MANPDVIGELVLTGPDEDEAHRMRRVLTVYATVMASSRNEIAAFNAAVQTYRSEKSDLPEEDARRAVAQIICRKP